MVPGIAGHHDGVERADVDAQFERVGRDHGADVAVAQPAFDLRGAPAAGSRRGSRESHRRRQRPRVARVLQVGEQDLGSEPAVREDQRLLAALDELGRNAARLLEVAAADAELAVDDRRVVEDEVLLAGGRAVVDRRVRTAAR